MKYPQLSHAFCSRLCLGPMAEIERMFPNQGDYRCHCPSITLRCKFDPDPLVATWYVLANGVQENCDGYNNHDVDATKLKNGILDLHINNSEGLDDFVYSCIAVRKDGSTQESTTRKVPSLEGQL